MLLNKHSMSDVLFTAAVWFTTQTGVFSIVCIRYSERLAEAGIVPSVGSIGDNYDNTRAEKINGLYKAEVIHRCGS